MQTLATVKKNLVEGLAHHKANRFDKAAQSYQQVLNIEPNNVDALHLLGVILLTNGEPTSAIEHIEHAVGLAPIKCSASTLFGSMFKVDDAFEAFQTALTLRPDFLRQALLNISSTGKGKFWLNINQAKKRLGII